MRKLYIDIASTIAARLNCLNGQGSEEWLKKHEEQLRIYEAELPSGSGFDSGSHIDLERSQPERIYFTTSYHHMNENGMYDGWTEHSVVMTPSLQFGYSLHITGKNRNDIKEYIHQAFAAVLDTEG